MIDNKAAQVPSGIEQLSGLLSSLAELAGALAWPIITLLVLWLLRVELKTAVGSISPLLTRVRKASLPGLEFELERVADAEIESSLDKGGNITPTQVEAAARIAIQAQEISTQEITQELDKLCLEYDVLRRTLPPGEARTRAMTRIVVKMRSLAVAPGVLGCIDTYKSSGSAGSRLAAIAMMQMAPRSADIDWLRARFSVEHPFLFYHAALALDNALNNAIGSSEQRRIHDAAEQAIEVLNKFKGTPDINTMRILESIMKSG